MHSRLPRAGYASRFLNLLAVAALAATLFAIYAPLFVPLSPHLKTFAALWMAGVTSVWSFVFVTAGLTPSPQRAVAFSLFALTSAVLLTTQPASGVVTRKAFGWIMLAIMLALIAMALTAGQVGQAPHGTWGQLAPLGTPALIVAVLLAGHAVYGRGALFAAFTLGLTIALLVGHLYAGAHSHLRAAYTPAALALILLTGFVWVCQDRQAAGNRSFAVLALLALLIAANEALRAGLTVPDAVWIPAITG